ncbi:molybdopterin-dependent oxidoreductase, partial [Geodermatophilus sp. CPCC 206100]|uniref:molybdopterin-dependent oxidoreductase n=1 Tax=Geodermatophilus sp. CPCC 206100 TaxID=3020054 RepID=UPI003B00DB64
TDVVGEQDKAARVAGVLVLPGLAGLGLGVAPARRRGAGVAGIAAFGAAGTAAAVAGPAGRPLDALPALVGAAAAATALVLLLGPLAAPGRRDPDRRRFLLAGGTALAVAVLGGLGGRLLLRRFDVGGSRSDLALPPPAGPAPALPPGADLAAEVAGLTPLVTANRDFYRIDTAITVPQLDPAAHRLRLTGMVAAPRTYTLDDLLGRGDLIERDITLTCVSNEVGGRLAGTARWLGVPLGAFLRENGVSPASDQLVCTSDDGMTIGVPTRAALEVPDAMLAVGMNGESLPVEHGFPLRMVVPGLYGYVSACKWLTGIEATTYDALDAFWVRRGWAASGPVRIASRIDTPSALRPLPPGRGAVAGVAWAQTRGIAAVEVQVDDGAWLPARLSTEVDADVWRQWVLAYDFPPGRHRLTVRATAGDGEVQTAERAGPYPAGATGLHSISVLVG